METKKNQKADIRNLRFIFLEIGMIVALGLVLAVFQWGKPEFDRAKLYGLIPTEMPCELPPITGLEKPKPPEPPEIIKPAELQIIKNNDQTSDNATPMSSEMTNEPIVVIPIEPEPEVADTIFDSWKVDVMPKFIGGDQALIRFIGSNTVFPKAAVETGTGGRVFVSFVINESGKVTQVELLRGVDHLLNMEALRVVSLMPDWTPGLKKGKPVKVKYQVPINFKIM